MRDLTPGEMLSLREMLTMETTGLVSLKTMQPLISDQKLKSSCEAAIQAAEGRIRSMQQFLQENQIITMGEVQ
jgi:ferritin-like metal-binding protein YciE